MVVGKPLAIPDEIKGLPNIRKAQLPQVYVTAKDSLAACESLDECKGWSDQAAALASYAKQARDDALVNFAMRIKARAIRRCGELLRGIEAKAHRPQKGGDPPPHQSERAQTAREAGLSDDQRKQALRVANVQEADFEAAIEAEEPATITELAEMGKQDELRRPKPPGFREATQLLGAIRHASEDWPKIDAGLALEGMASQEVRQLTEWLDTLTAWLDEFRTIINRREE